MTYTKRTCINCASRQPVGDEMEGTFVYGCERGTDGCDHWEPLPSRRNITEAILGRIIADVLHEIERAEKLHPPYCLPHEGLAIIEEELAELTRVVRQKRPDTWELRKEATHVACTAIRFLKDLCYK